MKYTLLNTQTSADTLIYDVVNEVKDEDGNITTPASQTPTDKFFVSITLTISVDLGLKDSEIQNPVISKNLTVESSKEMTGHEIEAQRKLAVENYMSNLNS